MANINKDQIFFDKLGLRLKTLRKQRNLRLRHLAEVLGITYQQYSKYEAAQARLPIDRLYILKYYYGLSYDEIIEGVGRDKTIV